MGGARAPRKPKKIGVLGSIPAAEIPGTWARIERVLETKQIDLRLRPPATHAQIVEAERTLGITFPDDFRASLLVHDGQEDDVELLWVPLAYRLGSLTSLVQCWVGDRKAGLDAAETKERYDWLDKTERVRQVHFDARQIPIAGSPYWDYDRLLLDFVPGPAGSKGQVIGRSDIDLVFIAETFGVLLADLAERLENGTLVPTPLGE